MNGDPLDELDDQAGEIARLRLTEEERRAIESAVCDYGDMARAHHKPTRSEIAVTLRGLLERNAKTTKSVESPICDGSTKSGGLPESREPETQSREPVAWAYEENNGGIIVASPSQAQIEWDVARWNDLVRDGRREGVAKCVPLYRQPPLTDEASERVKVLEAAIRALLHSVNARYPDKNPREWTCPHMAELDRLVR